jgi:3-phenylpropionate/trans-cinnamate dioxygenase ferredoxin subunit
MKITLCKEHEVGPAPVVLETDYGRIAVVRLDGAIFAFEDVCTHDDGPLAEGALEGDLILCPRHGAAFSMKSGKALQMPATEDIETFPLSLKDGMVEIEID